MYALKFKLANGINGFHDNIFFTKSGKEIKVVSKNIAILRLK